MKGGWEGGREGWMVVVVDEMACAVLRLLYCFCVFTVTIDTFVSSFAFIHVRSFLPLLPSTDAFEALCIFSESNKGIPSILSIASSFFMSFMLIK